MVVAGEKAVDALGSSGIETQPEEATLDLNSPKSNGSVDNTAALEETDNNANTEERDQAEETRDPVEQPQVERATETEKVIDNSDEASTASRCTRDCNYDTNPTQLFLDLQRRDWTAVLDRCSTDPDQARVWVQRNELDGSTLRWKLLPIHAAIIFDATEDVIRALLEAYPKGAQSRDDQGMLPLHLAFRHGSTVGIVNLLLVAFPQSVKVKDKKGRIPLVLVQASTSPNRDAFIQALQRGPTFYAVAAAATERAAVTTEQRAIFDAKLIEVEKKHKLEVDELKAENSKLETTVRNIKAELEKSQAATQVLVKLVNSLEGQLTNMSESESFLAKKIVALDANLKKINEHKDRMEAALQAQINKLKEEKSVLESQKLGDGKFKLASE